MFGLSLEHLLVLLLAGLFILGPERLPGAAEWLGRTLRKGRDYATTARDQIEAELGPEFTELRKPLQELNALRGLNPRTAVAQYLLDEPPTTQTSADAGNDVPKREPGDGPKVDMEAT
jgi:sec-independent protein translocase protein TatB